MTKPRSLTDHAAHLKHYREHFTVIFGQPVLPGQSALLSSAGSAAGRVAPQLYRPAGPAGTGRAGPDPMGATGQPAPVYQVRARLKSAQAMTTQEAGFRGTVFPPMVQSVAEPLQIPRGEQPDRAGEVGARLDVGSALSEFVGGEVVLGNDSTDGSTDARQTERVDSGGAFSGASTGVASGPAAEATFQEGPVSERGRWQSPPLPSPEDQERILVPEARVQSARPLTGSQPPTSRSAVPEALKDGVLARNTSTGQLGFRDLLGFANSAVQPESTRVKPEASVGSAHRQLVTDWGDTDAAVVSALLAAADRGSDGQAGASSTPVPTIPDVSVNTPATQFSVEPVFPDPVFPGPAFPAPGVTAAPADFGPERSGPEAAASLPISTQPIITQPSVVYQEQEPIRPRSARTDSGVEGDLGGSLRQVSDIRNQRPTEADAALPASVEASKEPGMLKVPGAFRESGALENPQLLRESQLLRASEPLRESTLLTVNASPSTNLTPTSQAARERPGADPRRQQVPSLQQPSHELFSPEPPSPEPFSPELPGFEATRPETGRPEQADTTQRNANQSNADQSNADQAASPQSETESVPDGLSSGQQTSSSLLQSALGQADFQPDAAVPEPVMVAAAVIEEGKGSVAAAQSTGAPIMSPEDTAGAKRPVQTGNSDPAPNNPGPNSSASAMSVQASLESASPDPVAPDAPVKFIPPGEDLETLRRLREYLPATDPGVGFSLPRRPRPVPIKAPKVAEVVPEAPVHTQEQALSFLDRLQRLAERESDGSSELRALSVAELLTWDKPPPSVSSPATRRISATSGEAPDAGLGLSQETPLSSLDTGATGNMIASENRAAPANNRLVEPTANPQATVFPIPATAADREAFTEAPGPMETAGVVQSRAVQTTPSSGQPLSTAGAVSPMGAVPPAETVSVRQSSFSGEQTTPLGSSMISHPPLPGEPPSFTAPVLSLTVFPAPVPAGRLVLKAKLNPANQANPVLPVIRTDVTVDPGRKLAAPDAANVPMTTRPVVIPPEPAGLPARQSAPLEESRAGEESGNKTPSDLAEVRLDRSEDEQTSAEKATAEKMVFGTEDARPASDDPASDAPASDGLADAAPLPSALRPLGQEVPILDSPLSDDRLAQLPVETDVWPENPFQTVLPGTTALAPEVENSEATASETQDPTSQNLISQNPTLQNPTLQNPATLQDRPAPVVNTPTTTLPSAASGLLDQPSLGQTDPVQVSSVPANSEQFAAALSFSEPSSRGQPRSDQPSPIQPTPDRLRSPGVAPTPSEARHRISGQADPVPASRLSESATEIAPSAVLTPAFAETGAAPGRELSQGREPVSTGELPKGVGDAGAVAADQITALSLTSENLPSNDLSTSIMSDSTVSRSTRSGDTVPPSASPGRLTREAPLNAASEPAQIPQGPTRSPLSHPIRQPMGSRTGFQAAPKPAENNSARPTPPEDGPINFGPVSGDSEPGGAAQLEQLPDTQPSGLQSTDTQLPAVQSPATRRSVPQSTVSQVSVTQSWVTQSQVIRPSDIRAPGTQPFLAGVNPAPPLSVQSLSALPLATMPLPTMPLSALSPSTQLPSIPPPSQPVTRQEQTLQAALSDPGAREPLPLSVRARLAPLLGRGLGETQLLRNAAAAAATSSAAADALAVGNTVLLSPGQDLGSPRGLGLLAHELTHVLRQRDPGFVPAVVRAARMNAAGSSTGRPWPDLAGVPASAAADEEGLAEHVEGLVREQFERRGRQQAAGTGFAAPAASVPSAEEPPWGSLPAPWEAMPFWDALEVSPTTSGGASRPSVPARTRSAGSSGSRASASQGVGASLGAVPLAQAASTTRSVPSSSADGAAKPALPAVGSDKNKARNAPDLDRLAQQVYSLIKGRLHTEIRRDR